VVKSTDYSSRGPEFNSQQPHSGWQPCVVPSSGMSEERNRVLTYITWIGKQINKWISKNIYLWQTLGPHTFNLSNWEAEAGRFLSLRPTWSTEQIPQDPELHRKTLSLKTEQKETSNHTHTHTHTHTNTYTYTHTHMYTQTQTHTYTYTYTQTHTQTHKHTYTQTHTHTNTHTHTHTHTHKLAMRNWMLE